MKIQKKNYDRTISESVTEVIFTETNVKQLILDHLKSNGFDTENAKVMIITDSKYIEDEWGMNRYLHSYFKEIIVQLPKDDTGVL